MQARWRHLMAVAALILLVVLLMLGDKPGPQDTRTVWEPYDRFGSGFLDPRAWQVHRNSGAHSNLDERREVVGASLRVDSNSVAPASLSVDVANPGSPVPVTALRAAVTLLPGTRSRGCQSTGYPPSVSSAGLVGRFFHDDGAGADVGGLVYLSQSSDGLLRARATVRYCEDPQCTSGANIWAAELGPLTRQRSALAFEWLAASERIVFTKDDEPPVAASVTGLNSGPPTHDRKGLQVWHEPPECPAGEESFSTVKVRFDDVDVNAGAVPVR